MIEHKIGQRSTDEAFVKLMTLSGDALLKLLGMDPQAAATYHFRATVLKQKRLAPDIEGWSLTAEDQPRVLLEFQGYEDPFVRYRLAAKVFMSCAQDSYHGPVLAGIIYTDRPYKKAALPLAVFAKQSGCRLDDCFVEVVLSEFSEEQLKKVDPRLLLLAPLTLKMNTDAEDLKRKGRDWQEEIDKSFPELVRYAAREIMGLFALARHRTINVMEVIQMLNLDLSPDGGIMRLYWEGERKGKQEGEQKGEAKILMRQLQRRFGAIPAWASEKISAAKPSFLEEWSLRIFEAQSLDEVFSDKG
ncbi:MAG: hypothetical protein HW380_725 [Magnetococcales bacterium]|nr:hypothetical protein [Magnetococcales bacterium]HIJ85207.1 DUF2887 domain-containing protein [Magnetococcales bacterium]